MLIVGISENLHRILEKAHISGWLAQSLKDHCVFA